MLTDGGENKRQSERQPVLKSAKVHFTNSVVDCLVLDLSATGARLSTELPVAFPEQVKIELRSGAVWNAVRRWQRGVETGFEIVGFSNLNLEASGRAAALYSDFRAASGHVVTERLAQEAFFDCPALRDAAAAFAAAQAKLEEAFRIALALR